MRNAIPGGCNENHATILGNNGSLAIVGEMDGIPSGQ